MGNGEQVVRIGPRVRWMGIALGWAAFAGASWQLIQERSFGEYWRTGLVFFLIGMLVQYFTSGVLPGRRATPRTEPGLQSNAAPEA